MKGAPAPSRNLIVSIPRQITAILSSQKARKQIQRPPGMPPAPGHMIFSIE
jgi:hypothetical protein